jgi:uncharacterized protein YbaP (TraB family)
MRLFIGLLFILTTSIHVLAQGFAPGPDDNSLLWEVRGKGIKQPSFIFGTIHLIPEADYLLSPATRQAFDQCDAVAFEIDLEKMSDISAMLPLLMKAFMRDGVTLRTLLNADDYRLVQQQLAQSGIPMMLVERVKPMFLSALMGQGGDTDIGSGATKSYELELLDMARKSAKPVHGLETAAYQMSMFDSIPYAAQAEMLVQSMKMGSTEDDGMRRMIDAYKNQDLHALQQMIAQESGMGDYTALLLDRRNANWIPVIERLMREQRVFVAVGAGHLPGEQGVIALLRSAGYQVKPVR